MRCLRAEGEIIMNKTVDMKEIFNALNEMSNQTEKKMYFAPLKEGKYTAKIVGIGVNEEPNAMLKAIGFYKKEQIAGRNNNYIRLDFETSEGKKTLKNVFPENEDNVTTNIRRQLNIEEKMTYEQTITYALASKADLEIWVNYNEEYKNVDLYDAATARTEKLAKQREILNAIASV